MATRRPGTDQVQVPGAKVTRARRPETARKHFLNFFSPLEHDSPQGPLFVTGAKSRDGGGGRVEGEQLLHLLGSSFKRGVRGQGFRAALWGLWSCSVAALCVVRTNEASRSTQAILLLCHSAPPFDRVLEIWPCAPLPGRAS